MGMWAGGTMGIFLLLKVRDQARMGQMSCIRTIWQWCSGRTGTYSANPMWREFQSFLSNIVFVYTNSLKSIYSYSFDQFLMNIVIFLVYTTRVVPVIITAFSATVGADSAITSRMNAIRVLSWLQGDDDLYTQLGFKLNRYMNTFYVVLVNLLMLREFKTGKAFRRFSYFYGLN